MRSTISFAAFLVLVASGAALPAGAAEDLPSADQIINSLLPRPGDDVYRGIRPATPQTTPQTPPLGSPGTPSAAPPLATQEAAGHPSMVNLNVQFRTNSAALTPAAVRVLDQLGRALSSKALSSYRFRIEGHTDTVGSRTYNKRLSEQRAQAVLDYLAAHYDVDRSRLEAVGLGEEDLLVPTPDQVAEPRNRRVQVVNLGG